MQSWYLAGLGSSDGGSSLFLPSRSKNPHLWALPDGRGRRIADRPAAIGHDQDHYAVLGIPRTASPADVKRAYRLLVRKYHPDVSRDSQTGEVFKSIRSAYEVLSDEVARARHDSLLKFPGATEKSWSSKWVHYPESEELRRRIYRWAELRKHMQYEKHYKDNSWHDRADTYEEAPVLERGSFSEVLRFAFFALFLMQTVGCRASLTLCGLTALLDKRLDIGYKTGYMIAWILGGRGGILLTLCINFTSWLCGKTNSSLVALVVVAMWVGANLARFAPLPQGAVLALLYMSIKLQVDMK